MRRALLALSSSLLILAPRTLAQDTAAGSQNPAGAEDAAEIASWKLGEKGVSLFMTGFWDWTVSGAAGFSRNTAGTRPALQIPLFSQSADLTLSLWMMDRWFVEGRFQDETRLSTYRMGYRGAEGAFVQYVGLGNTGLDFPRFPYLNLAGSSPSSLGVYARLGGGAGQMHALFRYDDAPRKERVFSGGRERTENAQPVRAIYRGAFFTLPGQNLRALPRVFLEDAKGTIAGGDGRRWKEAGADEYTASARHGLVELAAPAQGRVAVYYPHDPPGGYNLGSYGGGGFLGDIADYFAQTAGPPPDLAAYPQPAQTAPGVPGTVALNGLTALVVYEKGTFSPFERQSRYLSPSTDTAYAYLTEDAAGERDGAYAVELYRESESLVIADAEFRASYAARIYELRGAAAGANPRAPETMWPLAREDAALYLPGAAADSGRQIVFVAYSGEEGYAIGTGAVASSIQVRRGGLYDTDFSYDAGTGIVRLLRPALPGEVIRVSYLKEGEAARSGSIAAGLGVTYEAALPERGGKPPDAEAADAADAADAEAAGGGRRLAAGAGAGLLWNAGSASFSEEGSLSPGSAGLGAYLRYEQSGLNAAVRLGGAYTREDTAGRYRVAGMEGNERAVSLADAKAASAQAPAPDTAGLLPAGLLAENRAPLVFRDFRKTSLLSGAELAPIESGAPVTDGLDAPYPARDDALGGNVLAAEFSLTARAPWTGWTAALPDGALAGAREIEFGFRFYQITGGAGAKLFVQFGEIADGGEAAQDNPRLILTKKLFTFPATNAGTGEEARLFSLRLSEEERRTLQNARAMRLIVARGTADLEGRVLTGALVIRGAAFSPLVAEAGEAPVPAGSALSGGAFVEAAEIPDSRLERAYPEDIRRLHPGGERQRVLDVRFGGFDAPGSSRPGFSAGAGAFVGRVPLLAYKRLSFFARLNEAPPNARLVVALGTARSALRDSSRAVLWATIPAAAVQEAARAVWTRVELRYGEEGGGVFLDGRRVCAFERGGASLSGGEPLYLMFFLSPEDEGAALPSGSFGIDEVTLSESAGSFSGNLGASVAWQKNSPLWTARGVPVLANARFRADTESALVSRGTAALNEGGGGAAEAAFDGAAEAGVELLGFRLSADGAVSARPAETAWRGAHSIGRFFGPFGFEERFSLAPGDSRWRHGAALFLKGPASASLESESAAAPGLLERRWNGRFSYADAAGLDLKAGLAYDAGGEALPPGASYGGVWLDSWRFLAPDNGQDTRKRRLFAEAALNERRALFWGRAAAPSSGAAEPGAPAPAGLGLGLKATGETAYNSVFTRSGENAGLELSVPFAFARLSGAFSLTRRFDRALLTESRALPQDAERFAAALAAFGPLYARIPFYALFDAETPALFERRVLERADGGELFSGAFRDEYRLAFRMPAELPPLIPRDIDTWIRRDLNRTLDSVLDTLSAGGAIHHSAVNIAGAYARRPLFSFYANDELDSVISAEWTVPQGGAAHWKAQSAQSFYFYGFAGAELELRDTLNFRDDGWAHTFGIYWSAPAPRSVLGSLYDYALRRAGPGSAWTLFTTLKSAAAEKRRREKLEVSLRRAEAGGGWSASAGHESTVRVSGSLSLSAFAALDLAQDRELFSALLSAGLKMSLTW